MRARHLHAGMVRGLHAALLACAAASVAADSATIRYDGSRCANDCYEYVTPAHGYCSDGLMPVCQCSDQWRTEPNDCSQRTCASAPAWFDFPTSATVAHSESTPCASRGACNTTIGTCACDTLFEGQACQRMVCPGHVSGAPCNGHGRCMTLREAGRTRQARDGNPGVDYAEWDADRIQVCVCDDGWEGFDCALRSCPAGSDPLDTSGLEAWTIVGTANKVPEEQMVAFTLTGSTDEVQMLSISGGSGSPAGSLTLTMDTTSGCTFCATWGTDTTAPITITSGMLASTLASDVQSALNALSNVGAAGVTVSGSGPTLNVYTLDITFSGAAVSGNVPLLAGTCIAEAGHDCSTSIVETTAGSDMTGSITLHYDDTGVVPSKASLLAAGDSTDDALLLTPQSRTSASLSIDSSVATIQAAIEGLMFLASESASGVISVDRAVDSSGPTLMWRVTFTSCLRCRGNLNAMTHSDSVSGGTVAISTPVEGNWLGGTWALQLPYATPVGAVAWTALTSSLAADATAAQVQAALHAVTDGASGLGLFTVQRSRTAAVASTEWTGGYTWTVIYRSVHGDALDWSVGTPLTSALTGSGASVIASKRNDGSAAGQVNEVQILDCFCPACSAPGSEGVRLQFGDELTAFLPYNADAAAVRAALTALTSIPDVRVSMYDVTSSASQLCGTTLGVSTAITFTHNPGQPAKLRVSASTGHMALPAGSLFQVVTGPAFGAYGGVAVVGTRKLLPCSGRGTCDTTTGKCTCYDVGMFGASNNAGGGINTEAPTGARGWLN
ncbi:hypothetical protein EON66_04185, partial [archaeon]